MLAEECRKPAGQQAGDHRPEQMERARRDRDPEQQHRRRSAEVTGSRPTDVGGVQPSRHAGEKAGQCERPRLVQGDVHPCGVGGGLAAPDHRPPTTGAGAEVDEDEREAERRDEEREPEVGGVGLGEAGPRRVANRRASTAAVESGAAFGKADGVDHDEERAGGHQRDERQIETTETQRRESDDRAERSGHDAPDDHVGRHREMWIVQTQAQRHPRADAQQGEVGERHQAEPAVQQPDAERRQRVHDRCGERAKPVRTEERRDPPGEKDQDDRDGDQARDLAP